MLGNRAGVVGWIRPLPAGLVGLDTYRLDPDDDGDTWGPEVANSSLFGLIWFLDDETSGSDVER